MGGDRRRDAIPWSFLLPLGDVLCRRIGALGEVAARPGLGGFDQGPDWGLERSVGPAHEASQLRIRSPLVVIPRPINRGVVVWSLPGSVHAS